MIIYRLAATAPAVELRADYSQKESPLDQCATQCHESISSQPPRLRRVIPLCRLHLALPPPSLQDHNLLAESPIELARRRLALSHHLSNSVRWSREFPRPSKHSFNT